MIRHAAGLAEIVDDVESAVRFYTDVLGLAVKQRHSAEYVILELPGVLHFGIWSRAHAAECTFGDRAEAGRIPLGFTLELEVDDVPRAVGAIAASGTDMAQGAKTEDWGQVSARLLSPGGGLLGLAETPWGRRLTAAPAAGPEGDPEL